MERSLTAQEQWNDKLDEQSKRNISDNYRQIMQNISEAALRSGRKPEDIELVAVTKTVPVEKVNYAISLGVRHIGENRVQELASKYPDLILRDELKISVIGHLQTNKAKNAVELANMIQSVDSERVAQEISKRAQEFGKEIECLIEINIGEEQSKTGISFEQAEELVYKTAQMPMLKVCGLMTIPPFDADEKKLREFFTKINKLYVDIRTKNSDNNIQMKYLSMGMTSDYETAIECGSNMVRVGAGLFGARDYSKERK